MIHKCSKGSLDWLEAASRLPHLARVRIAGVTLDDRVHAALVAPGWPAVRTVELRGLSIDPGALAALRRALAGRVEVVP